MSIILEKHPSQLGFAIILSLILHLAVIVGGGSWRLAPSYRLTFGPVYEVKLVDRVPFSPMNLGGEGESLSGFQQPGALRVKKEKEAVPIRRIEREPAIESPEVKKALEEIRKRATSASNSDHYQDAPVVAKESAFNEYLRLMWERIRGEWVLPPGIIPSDRWEAVVNLRVLRNGKMVDVKMERSSGNAYFDRSVLRAIKKADPLPPFPPDMREESVEVGIRFHAQEVGK